MAFAAMDLTKLTPQELKNLLANNERHGRHETVLKVIVEMERRGIATKREYRTLAWNQERVREIMEPFKEVASAVRTNQRTSYTEAGGRKIGRAKTDPDRRWVDSYSAIKTATTNAVFSCYIDRLGGEPQFKLSVEGRSSHSYNADQLSVALAEWRKVADQA